MEYVSKAEQFLLHRPVCWRGGGGQQATYLVAKQDAEFPQDWLVIIID